MKIYVRHGLSHCHAEVHPHVLAVRLVALLDDRTRCVDAANEAITEALASFLAAITLLFALQMGRLCASEHVVLLRAVSKLVVDYAMAGHTSVSQYLTLRQGIAGHGAK